MRIHRPVLPLALLAAFATVAGTARATTLERVSAEDRLVRSELIVQARVVGVSHRNSDVAGPQHARLPHTFVTFAIERTFKGRSATGDQITLRMMGGPDGRGRTLRVSGVPRFAVGDRDVLFIAKNGEELCPLVGWEQGRLRIVRGEVFDALGRSLWVTQKGEFAFGEVEIDAARAPYLAVHQEAGFSTESEPRSTPPEGALRPDEAGFAAILEYMLREATLQGKVPEVGACASVSAGLTFHVLNAEPTPPPADIRSAVSSQDSK